MGTDTFCPKESRDTPVSPWNVADEDFKKRIYDLIKCGSPKKEKIMSSNFTSERTKDECACFSDIILKSQTIESSVCSTTSVTKEKPRLMFLSSSKISDFTYPSAFRTIERIRYTLVQVSKVFKSLRSSDGGSPLK
mmetsp:Transcript_4005/g.8395  ORF Transcript_4005/g.8395 Transcript_4005/m.8395 type:complete len:136 (+) Transcript_4005:424-831(+)